MSFARDRVRRQQPHKAPSLAQVNFRNLQENEHPRQESNLCAWFRKPALYPLSYGGNCAPSYQKLRPFTSKPKNKTGSALLCLDSSFIPLTIRDHLVPPSRADDDTLGFMAVRSFSSMLYPQRLRLTTVLARSGGLLFCASATPLIVGEGQDRFRSRPAHQLATIGNSCIKPRPYSRRVPCK